LHASDLILPEIVQNWADIIGLPIVLETLPIACKETSIVIFKGEVFLVESY